jgi:hypothetical protein
MILYAKGRSITSASEWFASAPPKGKERHWKPYRSALELARAWCEPFERADPPAEIRTLLESHPLSDGADLEGAEGWAELRVRIDDLPGEPRNTDVAFVASLPRRGEGAPRRMAVSIEAKADESFGPRFAGAVRAAEARRASGKASNGDARARALATALLGDAISDAITDRLRYQLLTATAGALALAQETHADLAVLVFHEFVHAGGVHTSAAKVTSNGRDLDAFLTHLSHGSVTTLPLGALVGPFSVPGGGRIPAGTPLLIGKVQRALV